MDRVVDAKLIKSTYTKDEIGQQRPGTEEGRAVVGALRGISRQEWTAVSQLGLNPQGMLFLRDEADYQNEEIVEVTGERYWIYRTFPTDDGGIELYYRKVTGRER